MKKILSIATIAFIGLSVTFTSCRNDAGTATQTPAEQAAPTDAQQGAPADAQQAAPAADTTKAQ